MMGADGSQAALQQIQVKLRAFAAAREWEQFHTPKNLVMALGAEVGELTELFQWLSAAQSSTVMEDATDARRVRDEVADVGIYLLRLADVLGVDLIDAILAKIEQSAAKYPVDLARGHATKYDRLGETT